MTEHTIIERETVTDEEELKPEYLKKFQQGMRDLGLWMYDIPVEHGGHLGFISRTTPRFWLDGTILDWMEQQSA